MTFCKSLCVNVSGWIFSVITNAIVITLGLERKKPYSKQKHNNGAPNSRSVSAEPPWIPGVSDTGCNGGEGAHGSHKCGKQKGSHPQDRIAYVDLNANAPFSNCSNGFLDRHGRTSTDANISAPRGRPRRPDVTVQVKTASAALFVAVVLFLPSTQEGRALVVPATCPGKQEHLTV